MNGYSKDLRLRVLDAVERGTPRREAARLFGVSLSTIKRYIERRRGGVDLSPRPSPGRTPAILATPEERRALWAQLAAHGDATLERHCELWERRGGARVSVATMSRAVRKLGWTYKKSLAASERNEQERGAWRERLKGVDPRRLVFVDESSTNIALAARYARAPKGERARGSAPRNRGKNVTLISSISTAGIGPSMSIDGPSDKESFGLYLRELLCPSLSPGQIVVMDNLSVHRGAWVRELIEARGASVPLLPPYSPDYNPIEEAFSKIKRSLRKAEARALEALFEATHRALAAVSEEDARGFFGHSGYSPQQVHPI